MRLLRVMLGLALIVLPLGALVALIVIAAAEVPIVRWIFAATVVGSLMVGCGSYLLNTQKSG